MMNYKQARIHGKQDLRMETAELRPPARGEVLVKVKASGVCGTDVHVYEDEVPLATLPVVAGHEFSGEVEEIGPGIDDVEVGDRVAIEPNLFCGYCHYCRNAKKHFCENWGAVGLTRDGGFAEYCHVPRQAIYKIPDKLGFKEAAFFEPVACVLHGIERSGVKAGDTAVVQGAGSIGLIYVQLLKAMGVKTVISTDIDQHKLSIAKKLGADIQVNVTNDDPVSVVKEVTNGLGAEVVVDAAGAEKSIRQAFSLVQDTGTIVIFGVPPEHVEIPVKMFDVYRRELSIVGSFTNPYTNEQALNILSSGKVSFNDIITHEISLDELEEIIIRMRDRPEGDTIIKAQVQI